MDRDTAYDARTGCTLAELAPEARWAVLAPGRDEARQLVDDAGLSDPLAVGALDDPGWHAWVRSLTNEDGVLIATAGAGWLAALEALRLLQARTGPFALVSPSLTALTSTRRLEGRATEARVVRLLLAGEPTPALVRARRAFGAAATRGDQRRARLAGAASPAAARRAAAPVAQVHEAPQRVVLDPAALPVPDWRWQPSRGPLTVSPSQSLPTDIGRHHHVRVEAGPEDAPRAVAAQVAANAALGLMAEVVDGPEGWKGLLSPDLVAAWDAAAAADLDEPTTRERCGVRLCRAARSGHDPRVLAAGAEHADEATGTASRHAPRQPSVSVLLPTGRPAFLAHALAQVARQRHRPLELVLAAHGEEAARGLAPLERSALPDDVTLTVVQVPGDRNLGQVLRAATEAASGEVLSKIDDDDWYGPEHVGDLVAALRWMGAPLVGKPFDFVYLGRQDLTLRRRPRIAEVYGTRVAGGTLTLHRTDLAELGGWAPVSRAVDRRLIEAVQREGERCYRVHSLQYVHNRHGYQHTWPVGSDYQLARARWQRPGLAREEAELDG